MGKNDKDLWLAAAIAMLPDAYAPSPPSRLHVFVLAVRAVLDEVASQRISLPGGKPRNRVGNPRRFIAITSPVISIMLA